MKTFLSTILFFLATTFYAQHDPVNWTARFVPGATSEGEIVISANIEKGWHTYSQRPTDAGPIPTSFSFTPSADFQLIGETKESDAHEEFVQAFEARIFVFTDKAEFRQKVKMKSKKPASIVFKVEYMCCNDLMCLPPKTKELTVKVQ